MDNLILEYAPIIIVVCAVLLKNRIFVTPEQLKDTRAEILQVVETKFATKEIVETIKDDIQRLEEKIDNLQTLIIEKINAK